MAKQTKKVEAQRPTPNPTGDLIISDNRLGVGTTDNLSTLTVRARDQFTLSGTLSKTAASATVTGTGTKFLSELSVGDRITVGSDWDSTKAVAAIASDTSLTVDSNYLTAETATSVIAMPSAARFDDRTGAAQLTINDQGNVGIGTMGPNAQLEVSGAGAGDFGGCPVNIRAHSPQGGDSWGLVLSYDAGATTPGVAQWVDDLGTGFPTLSFSFLDGSNSLVDTIRMDINGIQMPGAMTMLPLVVSTDYTVADSDQYIYVDATNGARNITLPNSNGATGRILWIFKIDSSTNAVFLVHPTGDTINGSAGTKSITTAFSGIKAVALLTSATHTWVATALPAAT